MTRLPRLKGKEIVRTLERVGFGLRVLAAVMPFSSTPTAELPLFHHSSETIGPGLLRAILRDVEMSVEDFLKL